MFDCCVAKLIWGYISDACETNLGADFESVAKWWIRNEKYADLTMISAAAMWSIWKLRNEFCFQCLVWRNIKTC